MRILLVFVTFLLSFQSVFSQVGTDSASFIPMVTASYAFQIPGGDLADRFGVNSTIGGSLSFKLKSNWIFSLEGHYIFGNNLKETSIFDSISDSNGGIISIYGDYALMSVTERGVHACVRMGRVFSVSKSNPNSGIMASAGVGYLQHKIWIEVEGNNAPQIGGDYRKGYDRLTSGFALNEFIGYVYYGKKRFFNFYGGFEFIQAWTKSRRSFNFDTMEYDDTERLDLLYSFRVGWIIPLNRRVPDKYYTH